MLLDPLCGDCPMLAAGTPPTCWTCERTRWPRRTQDAVDMDGLLQLGMSWDLALETLGWRGTRDELLGLARRVGVLRELRGPRGHHG